MMVGYLDCLGKFGSMWQCHTSTRSFSPYRQRGCKARLAAAFRQDSPHRKGKDRERERERSLGGKAKQMEYALCHTSLLTSQEYKTSKLAEARFSESYSSNRCTASRGPPFMTPRLSSLWLQQASSRSYLHLSGHQVAMALYLGASGIAGAKNRRIIYHPLHHSFMAATWGLVYDLGCLKRGS